MDWLHIKLFTTEATGLGKDALHIYAALAIQLGAGLLLRRPLTSVTPWLVVLAVLAINEALDLYLPKRPIEPWQIQGLIHDLWNTMIVPTVLLLLARFAPTMIVADGRAPGEQGRLSRSSE